MATKRTRGPRNRRPDELKAWRMMFKCGHDYFGDLEPFGFTRDDGDAAAHAAAPDAWRRLGAAFMADFVSTDAVPVAWAYEQFGPPPAGRG